MADDKKPKIDLKSRLGKKTVAAPTGSSAVPPPVGIPKPGVPVPPFAAQKAAPKVDVSDPYAAISAAEAPARVEPAAIKVEMSEEVVQAQKKGRSRIIALAFVTAVIGGVVGYAVGSGREKSKVAVQAVEGAQALVKEIKDANAKCDELVEVLKSAEGKLADNKFPLEEVSKLGGINIPFGGDNLTKYPIGRFKPQVVTMLNRYGSGSTEVNDEKEKLQGVLESAKAPIEDYLKQKEEPKVRWFAYFESGPYGPWVSMQGAPEPFAVGPTKAEQEAKKQFKWPEQFKIAQGGKTFDLKRYSGGDPTKDKPGEPRMIPVNPGTQEAVCPSDLAIGLRRQLGELREVLRGSGEDKPGLAALGEQLIEQLKSIGGPG
jgi:hypothetical protein